MKKNFLIAFALTLLLFPIGAHAELCTKDYYNTLKEKASKVNVEWNLVEDDDKRSIEVVISNMDKDLMLIYADSVYEYNDGNDIVLVNGISGGKEYQFKFYGAYYTPCTEEYVYTKNILIPKYNIYSELEECKEYSKWELCDKWYQGEIKDKGDFYEKLNEYKEKINSGEIKIEDEKDSHNSLIILLVSGGIIIIIAICLTIKYKRKKK